MKRFILPKPLFYLVAMPVLALLVTGTWITVTDGLDTYRLGQGADQILRIVGLARGMSLSPNTDPRIAQEVFLDTMKKRGEFALAPVPGSDPVREMAYAPVDPWGGLLRVSLNPFARMMRLQLGVNSNICRRFMTFYAKDPVALGLKRIDVLTDLGTGLWRTAYDETRQGGVGSQLTPQVIKAFCGQRTDGQIVLTFSL